MAGIRVTEMENETRGDFKSGLELQLLTSKVGSVNQFVILVQEGNIDYRIEVGFNSRI